MTQFSTLNAVLAARRDSTHVIHYIEGEHDERTMAVGELYDRAIGLLHHFQSCGVQPGSEMILLVENNQAFVDAFWACVLGGIIVVPLAPGNNDEHRWKFFRVLRQLQRPCLCSDEKTLARLSAFADANGIATELERVKPSTILLDRLEDVSRPGKAHSVTPDDIAFIQYSSGSTSQPKGVALTHRNLVVNIAAIAHGADVGPEDCALSWMPLTHDMGLIGVHLLSIMVDITHSLMPTALFVRRPQLWLAKVSEKRATLLYSPNFGYKHFLKTYDHENPPLLDLSPVRIIFNGAEPISVDLCAEFLTTLAPSGLKSTAMFPVYGLAEASLAVSFPKPGLPYDTLTLNRDLLSAGATVELVAANHPRATTLACVGYPVQDCALRIGDSDGQALPNNTVGRILIRGDNVTRRYYRDPHTTHATISSEGWLDTGDLGLMGPTGLVVTGRLKEILFANGQNYYPHDLEVVLDKYGGIELGKAAVSSARPQPAATDEVLIFVLFRGSLEAFLPITRRVRTCINEHIGIAVDHVVPVNKIPKTTSGKIQRYLLGLSYEAGEFADVIAKLQQLAAATSDDPAAAHGEIEKTLQEICGLFIKGNPIGVNDNIFELGTSSLMLAQIYQRIESIYPGRIEVTDFFDYPTIAELAKYLEQRLVTQA